MNLDDEVPEDGVASCDFVSFVVDVLGVYRVDATGEEGVSGTAFWTNC